MTVSVVIQIKMDIWAETLKIKSPFVSGVCMATSRSAVMYESQPGVLLLCCTDHEDKGNNQHDQQLHCNTYCYLLLLNYGHDNDHEQHDAFSFTFRNLR